MMIIIIIICICLIMNVFLLSQVSMCSMEPILTGFRNTLKVREVYIYTLYYYISDVVCQVCVRDIRHSQMCSFISHTSACLSRLD